MLRTNCRYKSQVKINTLKSFFPLSGVNNNIISWFFIDSVVSWPCEAGGSIRNVTRIHIAADRSAYVDPCVCSLTPVGEYSPFIVTAGTERFRLDLGNACSVCWLRKKKHKFVYIDSISQKCFLARDIFWTLYIQFSMFVGDSLINFSIFKAHKERTQVFLGGFTESNYHYYQETFDTDLEISLSNGFVINL